MHGWLQTRSVENLHCVIDNVLGSALHVVPRWLPPLPNKVNSGCMLTPLAAFALTSMCLCCLPVRWSLYEQPSGSRLRNGHTAISYCQARLQVHFPLIQWMFSGRIKVQDNMCRTLRAYIPRRDPCNGFVSSSATLTDGITHPLSTIDHESNRTFALRLLR